MKLNSAESRAESSGACQLTALLCVLTLAGAGSPLGRAQDKSIPVTEHGHPDIQGYWINDKRAPLQRPEDLGLQRSYTEEEVAEIVSGLQSRQQQRELPSDPNRPAPPAGETITNVADGNFIPEMRMRIPVVDGEYRTSIIIDPPNGRIAYKEGASDIYANWRNAGFGEADGPEIRPANERCLNSPAQLPLVNPLGPEDARTLQIIQTEDYVVLNAEYAVSLRIIPLNGESSSITWPQWRGVSIGRWEGNRLIVSSNLFRPEQSNGLIPSSNELRVEEVFSLTEDGELLYRFTFADPNTLDAPFTGELPLSRMAQGQYLYESACHEGNYALSGVLAGARRQEMDQQ